MTVGIQNIRKISQARKGVKKALLLTYGGKGKNCTF